MIIALVCVYVWQASNNVCYKSHAKSLGGISVPETVIRLSLAPSQPSWQIALLSQGEWQEQLPFKP